MSLLYQISLNIEFPLYTNLLGYSAITTTGNPLMRRTPPQEGDSASWGGLSTSWGRRAARLMLNYCFSCTSGLHIMSALARPQMRGLLKSFLTKHFVIGATLSVIGAAAVKFFCKCNKFGWMNFICICFIDFMIVNHNNEHTKIT